MTNREFDVVAALCTIASLAAIFGLGEEFLNWLFGDEGIL